MLWKKYMSSNFIKKLISLYQHLKSNSEFDVLLKQEWGKLYAIFTRVFESIVSALATTMVLARGQLVLNGDKPWKPRPHELAANARHTVGPSVGIPTM